MNPRVSDLLEQQADALGRGEHRAVEFYLSQAPEAERELRPLLFLAEQLRRALVPTPPSLAFRRNLRQGLYLAASQRDRNTMILPPAPWRNLWMGVAAVGSIVAAGGIVAWVVRSRVAPTGSFASRN